MKKITDQFVIAFDNRSDFNTEVQKYLNKGWQPKDDVQLKDKTTLYICAYTQTMVKYEE